MLYQTDMVAKGEGKYLLLTAKSTGGGWHASHLCHNPACFNLEHLVVEQSKVNYTRNHCHGMVIIEDVDGTQISLCKHHGLSSHQSCVLLVVEITEGFKGKNIQLQEGETFKIRGWGDHHTLEETFQDEESYCLRVEHWHYLRAKHRHRLQVEHRHSF